MNKKSLINQLKKLKKDIENYNKEIDEKSSFFESLFGNKNMKRIYIIHIDLYDSLYETEIKEFLFYFIFFKFYGQNNDIFNYGFYAENGIEIQIMIELPNTYKNYFNTYKILNYFPSEKIECNQNIPFILHENNDKIAKSIIEIVSGVLYLYYSKNNINIENCNLNLESKKNFLDENQCQYILNKILFKNEEFNLYQKINLLKYLSTEFIGFTHCQQLNPVLIFEDNSPDYFKSLRKNLIKSIIENSKYIIEMEHIERILFGVNEDEIDESIRKENHEKILSEFQSMKFLVDLDNLNPSLIAFHNNENLFSLISSNKYCEILKNMNIYIDKINNFYSNLPKLDPIKNPSGLNKDKYCEELLKLIIDENILKDREYTKIKNALKNNFEDYVFSKDNFLKMALLFIRIRAGIPTILMGETGSGKTYMIQMFSLIYSESPESLYILKFHSGTTDEDIMKFIANTIRKVNDDEDKIFKELKRYFVQDRDYYKQSFKNQEDQYIEERFYRGWFRWFLTK